MIIELESFAIVVVGALLIGSGCDVEATAVDGDATHDIGDLRNGCLYPSTAPARDRTYYEYAGTSTGGCDLYVGERGYYNPVGSRLFFFEAISDEPFSSWNAVVWGRACDGYSCGAWKKYEASPDDVTEETGYCDVGQQDPCIYKLTGYLMMPAYPHYDNYRVGFSAFDEDGDPVFMRYRVAGET